MLWNVHSVLQNLWPKNSFQIFLQSIRNGLFFNKNNSFVEVFLTNFFEKISGWLFLGHRSHMSSARRGKRGGGFCHILISLVFMVRIYCFFLTRRGSYISLFLGWRHMWIIPYFEKTVLSDASTTIRINNNKNKQ